MKFTLAITLVILVISHGTGSASVVRRDVPAEIEKLTKYFQDLSNMLTATTTELVEKIKAQDLTSQAEAYLTEGKAQVQPLLEKIQEQMKLTANMEAQLKPLAESLQAQLEDLLKKVMDQTKALLPPQ